MNQERDVEEIKGKAAPSAGKSAPRSCWTCHIPIKDPDDGEECPGCDRTFCESCSDDLGFIVPDCPHPPRCTDCAFGKMLNKVGKENKARRGRGEKPIIKKKEGDHNMPVSTCGACNETICFQCSTFQTRGTMGHHTCLGCGKTRCNSCCFVRFDPKNFITHCTECYKTKCYDCDPAILMGDPLDFHCSKCSGKSMESRHRENESSRKASSPASNNDNSPSAAPSSQFVGLPPDASSSSLLASIPDVSWQLIAAFAAPPDVYNLSLSSKHFFRGPTTRDLGGLEAMSTGQKKAAPKSTGKKKGQSKSMGRKKAKSNAKAKSAAQNEAKSCGDATASPLLATRLLRESLLSSLRRVLDHSASGITLEASLALADLPEGSAIIAGSTMAQACLGVVWDRSDVDVYCSAKAAPCVRSWLVEQAACMFVGFRDYRIELTDDSLLYTVDTKIHHVEKWGSIVENIRNNDGPDAVGSNIKDTDYYKEVTEYGKNCQKMYVDWKWKSGMCFDVLDVERNEDGAYSIRPEAGRDLPFDFNGSGSIDLIVARADGKRLRRERDLSKKESEKAITPFNLLEDFDLAICKASFDGRKFRIPNPHQTFSGKTQMEPMRMAIVESYVKHYKAPEGRIGNRIEQSRLASAIIEAVRKDIPNTPFYKQLNFAKSLPDRYTGSDFDEGSVYDPMVQAKYGAPLQFHNWTRKLILRLRKYQNRGIEVIDAPRIKDDFKIDHFYLTW